MDTSSLYGEFRNHFDLFWANTPELLEQAHRIRYAVYCREFRHERAEDYPDGLERDAYDPHAQHLLARHKASGLGAGCVRIIQPPPDDPHFLLPLER
ncbi:GNAT family N-acyltransferase, partial [Arthrospira platensis SPKY1]|nr:GNAT family N-acyltransferase [Arthrospira platensis SPKY1]